MTNIVKIYDNPKLLAIFFVSNLDYNGFMTFFKRICGIIVEYNPFHYGHLYHIKQAKSLSNCELLIAIMSPNIVQRGDLAILDKQRRAKCALQQGVNLVFELPSIFVLQNADVFAQGAIKLLSRTGITDLVFGSETADITYLNELAELNFNIDMVKEELKRGDSYPRVLGRLSDKLYPNDILALCYLRQLKNYPQIQTHIIKRTNAYQGTKLEGEYASASAIRYSIFHKNSAIDGYTPLAADLKLYHNTLSSYFNLIKYSLISAEKGELNRYLLIDEGIDNHLIQCAKDSTDLEDFLDKATTRRYTSSRIRRSLLNILLKVKKSDKTALEDQAKLRVLAFDDLGQQYLKQLNKQEIAYVTLLKNLDPLQKDLEYRIAQLYQLYYQDPTILEKETAGPQRLVL